MGAVVYLDTSALIKLLKQEPETRPLTDYLRSIRLDGDVTVSSELAQVELTRVLRRRLRADFREDLVDRLRPGIRFFRMTMSDVRRAGSFPDDRLGTLDAIHLAGALRVQAGRMITYDDELFDAASAHGLAAVRPARES